LLVQRLLHDLDQAVDGEEFERAAQLRDRLRDLGTAATAGKSANDGPISDDA